MARLKLSSVERGAEMGGRRCSARAGIMQSYKNSLGLVERKMSNFFEYSRWR